ncbi:MAG: MoxR family ATPase [Clostridiales bacterium]|nr:MoxR family ATPase [Clostridiales bacterium]
MKATTVKAVAVAIEARVPVLLWGEPGTGKTATVEALAAKLGLPLEVIIASIREPSDFSGLPVLRDDGVHLEPPVWAKRLAEAGKGILFLDEISTAPPAVQAALLRVVLDRVVGELELPKDVAVVAAANPPEMAAGGWDLTPPMANRFVHIDWTVDVQTWLDRAGSGFRLPDVPRLPSGWEDGIPQALSLVRAFIQRRPELLQKFPKNAEAAGRGWPSARSWTAAARLLAAAKAAGLGEEGEGILLSGAVGPGAALEFLRWRKDLDLPDPEDLLRDPESFRLPVRGDAAFAVLSSVAAAVLSKLTKERWMAAWDIMAKAAEQGAADVAAAAVRSLAEAFREGRAKGMPVPSKQLQPFLPLLKEAGLM